MGGKGGGKNVGFRLDRDTHKDQMPELLPLRKEADPVCPLHRVPQGKSHQRWLITIPGPLSSLTQGNNLPQARCIRA